MTLVTKLENCLAYAIATAFEKQMTDSKIADVRNLGERWGGATRCCIPEAIVPDGEDGEQIPWAHMDIAGTFGC